MIKDKAMEQWNGQMALAILDSGLITNELEKANKFQKMSQKNMKVSG